MVFIKWMKDKYNESSSLFTADFICMLNIIFVIVSVAEIRTFIDLSLRMNIFSQPFSYILINTIRILSALYIIIYIILIRPLMINRGFSNKDSNRLKLLWLTIAAVLLWVCHMIGGGALPLTIFGWIIVFFASFTKLDYFKKIASATIIGYIIGGLFGLAFGGFYDRAVGLDCYGEELFVQYHNDWIIWTLSYLAFIAVGIIWCIVEAIVRQYTNKMNKFSVTFLIFLIIPLCILASCTGLVITDEIADHYREYIFKIPFNNQNHRLSGDQLYFETDYSMEQMKQRLHEAGYDASLHQNGIVQTILISATRDEFTYYFVIFGRNYLHHIHPTNNFYTLTSATSSIFTNIRDRRGENVYVFLAPIHILDP